MNALKNINISYVFILLLPFFYQSVLAEDKSNNTYLTVARTQLNIAFDNYNKGDITASKENLQHASEWLYKAVKHSRSDKVKVEAQKLATEIDKFRLTLNKSSEKNDMVRFWHQASSLIKRESEQLIHSYTVSSTNNRMLRQLLDAKLHFYTADHDLFVSHDTSDAMAELNQSLEYLTEAKKLDRPDLQTDINRLFTGISELISLIELNKAAWKEDTLIQSLDNAIDDLNQAESIAPPSTRLQLESIKLSISKLKQDTQKNNLKVKYEALMEIFSHTVNNI